MSIKQEYEPCAYPNDAHGEHDHDACLDAAGTTDCEWCATETPYENTTWIGDDGGYVCRPCIDRVSEEARAAEDAYYHSPVARADFWEGVPTEADGSPAF